MHLDKRAAREEPHLAWPLTPFLHQHIPSVVQYCALMCITADCCELVTSRGPKSYINTPLASSPLHQSTLALGHLFSPSQEQHCSSLSKPKAMASHALALYQAASSPYNLDGDLSFTWDDLVREDTLTLEATPPHFHH
jgi:hypothetical protein